MALGGLIIKADELVCGLVSPAVPLFLPTRDLVPPDGFLLDLWVDSHCLLDCLIIRFCTCCCDLLSLRKALESADCAPPD